jgi:hypothetical protein
MGTVTLNRMTVWKKLYPAVPRHWLLAIASGIWSAAGALLCLKAIVWLDQFPLETNIFFEMGSVCLAGFGYLYGFSKAVQKNIDRIRQLPDSACAFAFTPWRGYLMIGLMVGIGITLRNSPIPKYYLAVPYAAMGGMLLIGAVQLFRQFLVIAYRKN